MKKTIITATAAIAASVAHAGGVYNTDFRLPDDFAADSVPASLCEQVPEQMIDNAMAMLKSGESREKKRLDICYPEERENVMEEQEWTGSATNAVKPYKFMDDLTFVGVPIFVTGIIAKAEKRSFRQNTSDKSHGNTRLLTDFHSEVDNYTQYGPIALAAGLNFAGVKGRSDHLRFVTSAAISYAIMAGLVNSIKYTSSELRPDGSTYNSWPSGHTATAFASATILHKEYGLTRSPLYSVFGYAMATATGIMRVLNNRHWASDVLSGAGIGIMSTELAYGISDLIFKGKRLNKGELDNTANIIENPSFFDISMGIGFGNRNLSFSGSQLFLGELTQDGNFIPKDVELKFGAATTVGVEGAYFFNKYIGVGGRLKVRSTPIKGWSDITSKFRKEIKEDYEILKDKDTGLGIDWWITTHDLTIESDHITEFSANVGAYFNLPLSRKFALGSKLLIGRSIIQDLQVDAHFAGNRIATRVGTAVEKGDPYDITWSYMTVSGNNTMTYGTGLSLTYAYKSRFSWKLFIDYDFTRKRYTMKLNQGEFLRLADPQTYEELCNSYDLTYDYFDLKNHNGSCLSSTRKKNMNNFVVGGSFCVSF